MRVWVYFDYCALLILITLLLSFALRRLVRGKANYLFYLLLFTIFVTCFCDIASITLDRQGDRFILARYIFHSGYLLLHTATTPIYVLYQLALTDTWHRLRKYKSLGALLVIPVAGIAFLLMLNPWTRFMFYFNETGDYTRGNGFWILYLLAAAYFFFGLIYLIANRKLISRTKVISLMVIYPAMASAVMIQWAFPWMALEMFSNAIALLFASVMIQRPEEVIDIYSGLENRIAYTEDVKRAFVTSKPIHIIMVTLTNYQTLTDILDQDGVEELIRRIADYLTALSTKGRLFADLYYIGDGRFRIVFSERNFNLTAGVAERINRALKNELPLKRMSINLLTSVCVARCPEDIRNYDDLQSFAKDVVRRQKYTGEVLYAEDLYREEYYDAMRNIDATIEEALANNLFEVYYQPIYCIADGKFHSAEALLRLHDKDRGFISPEIFIPAAENNGSIHRIGDFVLREVCRFIGSDEFKNLDLEYIEVNLSVVQCMRNQLHADIDAIMKEYQVEPEQINLEITETAASYSQNTMMENIDALVERGIPFSLDDFGTGYSNMTRIASMPFTIVKLDKTFTDLTQKNMKIVLENTINMIKKMEMEIVVEGVETKEMVERFTQLECNYIQGFYFSKPLPRAEFVAFLESKM